MEESRMKRLSITALAVAAVGFSGAAFANDTVTEIFSPESGEVIYKNTLELSAADTSAFVLVDGNFVWNSARWAVRKGTCAASTGAVAGNVDGFSNASSWVDGYFSAELDATGFLAGEYCFVLNTELGAAQGNRQTQIFYIVDKYAKVGGTIYLDNSRGDIVPGGNSPTDTVDGVVGVAGTAGVVGSITVNYRLSNEYKTYEANAITFRNAAGIGVYDPMAVAEIRTSANDVLLVLDRDASPDFPRGALIVRPEGWAADYDEDREIDNTPGQGGADSWVPMHRGNNHVGTR
jgi:hypothetical protein